jgi:hypothetical protein
MQNHFSILQTLYKYVNLYFIILKRTRINSILNMYTDSDIHN